MSTYAVYNNKVYSVNVQGRKLRLKSFTKGNGFKELIDIAGNKHNDIFIKEVRQNDVEMAYELQINAIYKGKEFETQESRIQ